MFYDMYVILPPENSCLLTFSFEIANVGLFDSPTERELIFCELFVALSSLSTLFPFPIEQWYRRNTRPGLHSPYRD